MLQESEVPPEPVLCDSPDPSPTRVFHRISCQTGANQIPEFVNQRGQRCYQANLMIGVS